MVMLQFNKHLLSITSKLPWWRYANALNNSSSIKPIPTELKDRHNDPVKGNKTSQITATGNSPESLLSNITPEKDIDYLLNIAREPNITVEMGTKILSVITNKINSREAKVRDIFKDPRFLKLQEIILEHDGPKKQSSQSNSYLTSFSDHSVGSLVATLKQLATQRKRNLPVLIALVTQIADDDNKLTLRQCTDILYSMATLNFHNEVMLVKVIQTVLDLSPNINQPRMITSLLTSMGMLRYNHTELLSTLYDKAVLFHPSAIDSVVAAIQTAATLLYKPDTVTYFAQNVSCLYKRKDMPNLNMWLDYVWSLLILEFATPEHIASVLTEPLTRLKSLSISKKLKVINLNSAAMMNPDYHDHVLNEDEIASLEIKLSRSVEQQVRVQSLEHVLSSMMPSQEFFTTNINTDMGFYLDAECHYDMNGNPVELATENVGNPEIQRIGIMLHAYSDYFLGSKRGLIGQVHLHKRLLERKNYVVVSIPYEEYSIDDNIKNQATYLNKRIEASINTK